MYYITRFLLQQDTYSATVFRPYPLVTVGGVSNSTPLYAMLSPLEGLAVVNPALMGVVTWSPSVLTPVVAYVCIAFN